MVHAYCEIRDSWTGWLRSGAMGRTLFERIVPEMRDLQGAERRIVDQPSVTLLSVLDYAARARQTVPTYTPLKTIDYPQPPVSAELREACERLTAEAAEAALAARRASARAYAARMTSAIERERAEEARRQKAMAGAGVTETPVEAEAATARVEARIAFYEHEIRRVYDEAGLGPDGKPTDEAVAPEGARENSAPEGARENSAPEGARKQVAPAVVDRSPAAAGLTVAWQVHARRWGRTILVPTPETVPALAGLLLLIDRGKRGGTMRAFGGPELDGRHETINGVAFRLARRRDGRHEARLTPAEVRKLRHAERRAGA